VLVKNLVGFVEAFHKAQRRLTVFSLRLGEAIDRFIDSNIKERYLNGCGSTEL
jgi:hypothetical protein